MTATPAAAQVAPETIDGFAASDLRAFWEGGVDIHRRYTFDHAHSDVLDAVEGGGSVLTMDRESEEAGEHSRDTLMAHCRTPLSAPARPGTCRYRLVRSSVSGLDEEVAFDAAGAVERLRAAGVTPEAFTALARAVPAQLAEGSPPIPDRWGEVRTMHRLIIAPVLDQYAANSQITTIDSDLCPAMLTPLRRINNLALGSVQIAGLSNDPPLRMAIPHSAAFGFTVRAGGMTLRWQEAGPMSRMGIALQRELRQISELCHASATVTVAAR